MSEPVSSVRDMGDKRCEHQVIVVDALAAHFVRRMMHSFWV